MNVDYSLVSSGRGGQEGPVEYNVKAAPFGVSLSDRVEDGRTFSLNLNGYKIEWSPVGANNSQVEFAEKANDNTQLEGNDRFLALANVSSKCSYLNVYNDVDIEYCISSYGVKENIILNSSKAQNEFVYRYNIGSLKAEQTTSNTITLLDANSKAVTKITAPYMIDSEGKTSDSISLIIEKIVGGVITLRLTADLEWLLSAERRYPVTIDPVMNTQINYSQTFIASSVNYDDTNFSGRGDMYVG